MLNNSMIAPKGIVPRSVNQVVQLLARINGGATKVEAVVAPIDLRWLIQAGFIKKDTQYRTSLRRCFVVNTYPLTETGQHVYRKYKDQAQRLVETWDSQTLGQVDIRVFCGECYVYINEVFVGHGTPILTEPFDVPGVNAPAVALLLGVPLTQSRLTNINNTLTTG